MSDTPIPEILAEHLPGWLARYRTGTYPVPHDTVMHDARRMLYVINVLTEQLAEARSAAPELPTVTLPWTGPAGRVEVDESGNVLLDPNPVVLSSGTDGVSLTADDATEAAAALLAAVRAALDITGERGTITLHTPALAAEPQQPDVPLAGFTVDIWEGRRIELTHTSTCTGYSCSYQETPSSAVPLDQLVAEAARHTQRCHASQPEPAPNYSWRWELHIAGHLGSWAHHRHSTLAAADNPEHLARLIADQHLEDRDAGLRGTPWRVLVWRASETTLTAETAVAWISSAGMILAAALRDSGIVGVLTTGRGGRSVLRPELARAMRTGGGPAALPRGNSTPTAEPETCGDCASGKCHLGDDPDDCGCALHEASTLDPETGEPLPRDEPCCADHDPACAATDPGAECCDQCPDRGAPEIVYLPRIPAGA